MLQVRRINENSKFQFFNYRTESTELFRFGFGSSLRIIRFSKKITFRFLVISFKFGMLNPRLVRQIIQLYILIIQNFANLNNKKFQRK